MADIRLSELSQATSVATTDLIEISQDQGGENYTNGSRKVTFDDFGTSLFSNVQSVQFDTQYTPPGHSEGLVHWDDNDKTLEVDMSVSGVHLQLGQEMHIYCRNDSGLAMSNGDVVYVSGDVGTSRPTIELADASNATTSKVLGVVTHNIANGSNGYVTTSGLVREVATGAGDEGAVIYLSDTTPGAFTTSVPTTQTNYVVKVGQVITGHASNGSILVSPGLCFNDLRATRLTVMESANFFGNTIVTYPVTTVSNTYSVDETMDYLVLANATSGSFTVTLPSASNASGRQYTVKKIDTSSNTITVDGNGAETIDGDLNIGISGPYNSLDFISDGSQWFIM